jgi:hypothetical protein
MGDDQPEGAPAPVDVMPTPKENGDGKPEAADAGVKKERIKKPVRPDDEAVKQKTDALQETSE